MSQVFEPIPQETRRAIAGSGLVSKRGAKHLLKMGRQWKPTVYGEHFDTHMQKRRLLYEGKTEAVLDEYLRKVYPETWERMQKTSPSLLSLAADLDATTYDRVARRWIVRDGQRLVAETQKDDKGNVTAEAHPAAQQFEAMVQSAKLDSKMLEGERRVNTAYSIPVRVDVDFLGSRLEVRPFWPCDVWIVPFAPWAHSLDYALAVVTRVASGQGASTNTEHRRYLLEVRDAAFVAGRIEFGNWRRMYIDDDGNVWAPPEGVEWGQRLPMTMWHLGIPELPFIDMHRDRVRQVLAAAESWTNLFFILQMQAHDETTLETKSTERRSLVVGPGAFNQLEPGERLTTITREPKVTEYADAIDAFVTVLAKTWRQGEDSYSKEASAPMTALSRKVKDRHYEKASRERELFAVQHERDLLRLMAELSDEYLDTNIHDEANEYHMEPDAPIEFEDPTARDSRTDKAVDRGEISPARGSVIKQLYPDEAAAAAMGLSRALQKSAASPAAPDRTKDPVGDGTGNDGDDDGGDEGGNEGGDGGLVTQ